MTTTTDRRPFSVGIKGIDVLHEGDTFFPGYVASIVGARKSGKTSLARTIARHVASPQTKVLFCSAGQSAPFQVNTKSPHLATAGVRTLEEALQAATTLIDGDEPGLLVIDDFPLLAMEEAERLQQEHMDEEWIHGLRARRLTIQMTHLVRIAHQARLSVLLTASGGSTLGTLNKSLSYYSSLILEVSREEGVDDTLRVHLTKSALLKGRLGDLSSVRPEGYKVKIKA